MLQGVLAESWVGAKWHRLTKAQAAETFAFVALEFYMLDSVINYAEVQDDSFAVGPANMQEVIGQAEDGKDIVTAGQEYVLKRSVI